MRPQGNRDYRVDYKPLRCTLFEGKIMIAGPFNIAINKGPNFAVVSPDGYINQTGGGQ